MSNSTRNGRLHINIKAYLFIIIFIICSIWCIKNYGEHLALVQKVAYTIESVSDSGEEQNLNLRVGAWTVFGLSLLHNPWAILVGYGFNHANYVECIKAVVTRLYNVDYVTVPESFFIQAWSYGGIICLVYAIIFWVNIYRFFKLEKVRKRRILLLGLFVGLLLASAISGAAIISDLLYGQFLIFIGFLIKERRTSQSSSIE